MMYARLIMECPSHDDGDRTAIPTWIGVLSAVWRKAVYDDS